MNHFPGSRSLLAAQDGYACMSKSYHTEADLLMDCRVCCPPSECLAQPWGVGAPSQLRDLTQPPGSPHGWSTSGLLSPSLFSWAILCRFMNFLGAAVPAAFALRGEGRMFRASEGNSGSLMENAAFVMKCRFLCGFTGSTAAAAWMRHFREND